MGIYKRGPVWWMSFTCQGKHFRKSTETDDKELAQRIFDKVKGEIAERNWFEKLPGEDITFTEMMDKYMSEHSAVNKAPRSHERDKGLRKKLEPVFGNMILTEISPRHIAEYKVMRRKDGVSPRTVNYELALMSHAFNLAIREWEWVKDNPVSRVRKERVNNFIERWLTLEEEDKLLKASPEWLRQIITFAIYTGLRQGEIIDLKWSQVDLSRRTVTILEQKNRSVDTLPLNRTALDVLCEKAKCPHNDEDRVFPNQNGKRFGHYNLIRSFHLAIRKAGIRKLRFHDLRHTFATRLVQSGVDLYQVQKLGRWKNTSMILRYAHHFTESLRAGIEVMDRSKPEFITNLSQSQENGAKEQYIRLVKS
ncbi:MAG: site-specific integrase [Syntrophales bacterium]